MMHFAETSKYSFILVNLMISGRTQNRDCVSTLGGPKQLTMNNHRAITLHLEAGERLLNKWKSYCSLSPDSSLPTLGAAQKVA